MPFGSSAVVVLDNGTITLGAGSPKIWAGIPGNYEIIFVDVTEQRTAVRAGGRSADNWNVELIVEVVWRIITPIQFIHVNQPTKAIQTACREALIDVIQSFPHDKLVGSPSVRPVNSRTITSAVQQRLVDSQPVAGVRIKQVVLYKKVGDAERMTMLQQASAEKTRYENGLTVMAKQTEFQMAQIAQNLALIDNQLELKVKQAQQEWQSELEQMRGRVATSRMAVEEGEQHRRRRLQDIQLDRLAQSAEREYQLAIEALKARSEALRSLTQAMTTAVTVQGPMANIDQSAWTAMRELVEAVTDGTSHTPMPERAEDYQGEETLMPSSFDGSNGKVSLVNEPRQRPFG